jgi:hypothetical protein
VVFVLNGLSLEILSYALCDLELSAKFAAGALADAKKANEVAITVSLGTLCDIGGHRDGSALHLSSEFKRFSVVGSDTNLHCEAATTLPNLQVLESL